MVERVRTVQKNNEKSRMEIEKTYGEKWYSFIFDNILNFWVNLIASGAFNYWAHNYVKPIKWLGDKTPFQYFEAVRDGIERKLPTSMRGIDGKPSTVATAMANALTLVTAGHFVMIPSVWIGAKIKAPFVRWMDRNHYGANADDDSRIAERHRRLDTDPRPTLFGSVIGRIGTMLATQVYSFGIGGSTNLIRSAGNRLGNKTLQKFNGLDPITEEAGLVLGKAYADRRPQSTEGWNKWAQSKGFGWSKDQINHPTNGIDTKKPYNYFIEDMSRYIFLDVIYTWITSSSIHWFIDNVKKVVPGMTYTPKAARRHAIHHAVPAARFMPDDDIVKNKEKERPRKEDRPRLRVSQIENFSTVSAQRAADLGVTN